jgi:hypothetical protein
MIRSVLAVLAGIAVLTITSFAIAMEAAANPLVLHLFPRALPNEAALRSNLYANLFMYLYTTLGVVAGGYVTACVARHAPVWHAVAMGVIQLGLTVWAMKAVVVEVPSRNWIVGMVMVVPAAWCGGLLRARQIKREESF